MTVQTFGLVVSLVVATFVTGVGVGRLGQRGHHRAAAWGLLAVLVLAPAVLGFILGGAS